MPPPRRRRRFIQLKFLNNGLQRFDVLFVLPIYQAFWIIGAAVNGMLFFEEYLNFSAIQYLMFPAGCICTISGVAMLSCNFEQSTNLNNNLGDKVQPRAGAASAFGPATNPHVTWRGIDRFAAHLPAKVALEATLSSQPTLTVAVGCRGSPMRARAPTATATGDHGCQPKQTHT